MIFNKTLLDKWLVLSTCSLALLPVVPYLVNSICIIVWLCLVLVARISGPHKKIFHEKRDKLLFFLFGGNFFFLVFSLLYSIDRAAGGEFIVGELSMLVFPLGFFLFGLPVEDRKLLKEKVLTACWTATLLMTLWIFFCYQHLHLFSHIREASSFNTIFRDAAQNATGKHPDYLSLYLVFALFIAANRMIRAQHLSKKILYALSLPLFLFLLLMLAERSPILGLAIGSIIICFLQIKKMLTRWAVLLALCLSFLVVIRYTPSIYSRVLEVKNTALTPPVGLQFNSTNIRIGIYECSWELIRKNICLGVGAGSDRKLLSDCYTQFPTEAYKKTYYNTHNQYVNFWLLSGFASLLLFLCSLSYSFVSAFRRKDYTQLFFIIIMTIAFASENILSSQAGVVFYYLFICLMEYCKEGSVEGHTA